MKWYEKKAMIDPAAHVDDAPPVVPPDESQLPMPQADFPRLKLKPRGKATKSRPNLWRKNRE
jgi:hypothetical protein